jgi:hypothetical protein
MMYECKMSGSKYTQSDWLKGNAERVDRTNRRRYFSSDYPSVAGIGWHWLALAGIGWHWLALVAGNIFPRAIECALIHHYQFQPDNL